MTTVVDALIMTLGLDTRDYDKGNKSVDAGLEKTKKHANLVAKEMYEGGKKAASFFGSIKSELISLLAVAAAGKGLTSFLHDSIGGMAELGRQAANLSMAPKMLDAWGAAAETFGGTADATLASIKGLAAGLQTFGSTGASPMLGILRTLGVQPTFADGKVKAYSDIMEELANKFKTMTAQQALFYGKHFGFDEGTIQLLRQGGPAVKALVEQMSALSGATDAGVASAQKNQAEWAKIRAHFKGIRETISSDLNPALEKIANRVLKWMDANHQLIATKITYWLDRLVDFLPKLVSGVKGVVDAFGGWKNVALILGGVMALKVLSPVIGLISGLTRLLPLIAASTAGLWGLAGAGAAIVGWKVGSFVSDQIEGTKAGDWLGRFEGRVMAGLGNNAAWTAMQRDEWGNLSASQRSKMAQMYGQMSASDKVDYDKRNPELARLIQQVKSSPKSSAVNSQHSRAFATNAELFGALESHGGLPSGILQKMFMQESGGGKHLLSSAGAKGPFQFMDATAADVGLHGNDVYDLDKSAAAAAGYLVKLRGMFGGDMTKAVAAYNAGPGNVQKYGGVPPFSETQAYVSSIMGGISPNARLARLGGGSSNTITSETKIGPITVNTAATDAKGIVRDMREELSRNQLIAASNRGSS